jgi:hypothetical protein
LDTPQHSISEIISSIQHNLSETLNMSQIFQKALGSLNDIEESGKKEDWEHRETDVTAGRRQSDRGMKMRFLDM